MADKRIATSASSSSLHLHGFVALSQDLIIASLNTHITLPNSKKKECNQVQSFARHTQSSDRWREALSWSSECLLFTEKTLSVHLQCVDSTSCRCWPYVYTCSLRKRKHRMAQSGTHKANGSQRSLASSEGRRNSNKFNTPPHNDLPH